MYCRIRLSQTNYKEIPYKLLDHTFYDQILGIYATYTKYKQYTSVMPLFIEELSADNTDIIGYYDQSDELQAFSLIYKYPSKQSCINDQFAWTYHDLKEKLGYRSIRSECARYKRLGYKYMYLGEVAEYKKQLQGFELI